MGSVWVDLALVGLGWVGLGFGVLVGSGGLGGFRLAAVGSVSAGLNRIGFGRAS